jgi:hypothetical protein
MLPRRAHPLQHPRSGPVSRIAPSAGVRIEYLILVDPKPAGPVLGYYNDRPIPAAVVDYFGRRYVYAGIAPRRRNGQYDTGALGTGERLMEPGLVYRDEALRKRVA